MSKAADLLIEIGTEELPPKALKELAEEFAGGVRRGLNAALLRHGEVRWYATPRRLAVYVVRLARAQPDRAIEKRGPAYAVAYDAHGKPTRAAEGFAQSCGIKVQDLQVQENDKGKWVVARYTERGRPATEIIPQVVRDALQKLPVQKRMRWGAGEVEFVRPVHWAVLLHGSRLIKTEILGVRTERRTRGHRFHHPAPITLRAPGEYAGKLESKGCVIADFARRREMIAEEVRKKAAALGGEAVLEPELLDEVTAMVEWPVAITGSFAADLLELPPEVLTAVLEHQQRYFPVTRQGRLTSQFIAISNIRSRNPERVRAGNEKVIHPRLTDAAFFWERDRHRPLADYREELKGVIFQKELGSLYDRSERLARLAGEIAIMLKLDAAHARRAGELSKCDLVTSMVGEFPELQGVMGRYYAQGSGEPEPVALAIEEQYRPRFAGDALPATGIGRTLALADKLDALVGIFSIGQAPSGEKDPFGLRRAALGVLRIMIECRLDLDLESCLRVAAGCYNENINEKDTIAAVFDFMMERLRGYYLDAGVTPDTFEAVLATRPTRPYDFHLRLEAVQSFRDLPQADSLTIANKRIANILRQAGVSNPGRLKAHLLREPAEKQLAGKLIESAGWISPLISRGDYTAALKELAGLRDCVDTFFDNVLVMCDDEALRNNRLALLGNLSSLFQKIADISRLQN